MKTLIIISCIILIGLFLPQFVQAQGTMTYLSNLDQTTTGSLTVGSDSWLAAMFVTGTNASGYLLGSVQLGMADASGSPSGFKVMLYTEITLQATFPGSSLGGLNGSLNPTTAGIYTYAPASSLTLSPHTYYFIVLTAETTITGGAYEWNYVTANSYNPNGGWGFPLNGVGGSSNGTSWPSQFVSDFPQFAINATAIPEPATVWLIFLGGGFFLYLRRNRKKHSRT
jgi:hypothetical protein